MLKISTHYFCLSDDKCSTGSLSEQKQMSNIFKKYKIPVNPTFQKKKFLSFDVYCSKYRHTGLDTNVYTCMFMFCFQCFYLVLIVSWGCHGGRWRKRLTNLKIVCLCCFLGVDFKLPSRSWRLGNQQIISEHRICCDF